MAYKKYFTTPKTVASLKQGQRELVESGTISPYDALIKKYATQYGFDWRLVAAQMYQETRFDPKAKSWVGAQGLLQVMPATAREMGFKSINTTEQGIAAGVKYLDHVRQRFPESLPVADRMWFTLAAYNAGAAMYVTPLCWRSSRVSILTAGSTMLKRRCCYYQTSSTQPRPAMAMCGVRNR